MPSPKNQSLLRPIVRRAFTLVELLVVIAIIIVIAAVAMPAVNAMLRGNAAKQGSNMVSAFLTSARAIAMSNHRRAGVVFYEDPGNKNQTAVMICLQVPGSASQFTGAPNRGIDYLPRGVRVAAVDTQLIAGGDISSELSSEGVTLPRLILFEGNGQMVLASQLSVQTWTAIAYQVGDVVCDPADHHTYVCLSELISSGGQPIAQPQPSNAGASYPTTSLTATPAPQWAEAPLILSDPTTGNAIGYSSPGVLVYDRAEYEANNMNSTTSVSDFTRSQWLQKNGELLLVNAYTGAVVR